MRWERFLFGKLVHWLTRSAVLFAPFVALDLLFRICNGLSKIERSEAGGALPAYYGSVDKAGRDWYER